MRENTCKLKHPGWSTYFAIFIFISSTLTALHQPALASGIQEIKDRGQLVVAITADDYYPYFFQDGAGRWHGADIDLAQDLAATLGVELVVDRSSTTFDEVIGQVARGEVDIAVSMLSITLSRAEKVLFTEPYVTMQQALLLNRVRLASARTEIHDFVAFINETGAEVGVLAGTSYVGFARELFPKANVVPYPDLESLYHAVQQGDVLAIHFDENTIKQFVFEDPQRLITLQAEILSEHEDMIAMVVAPSNSHLLSWLNTYLRLKRVEWTIDELLDAYPRSVV